MYSIGIPLKRSWQCNQILIIIFPQNFTGDSKGSSSIDAHVRHILDRFHCFFSGVVGASIDYDARKRDPEMEQNAGATMFAQESVARLIELLQPFHFAVSSSMSRNSCFSLVPLLKLTAP